MPFWHILLSWPLKAMQFYVRARLAPTLSMCAGCVCECSSFHSSFDATTNDRTKPSPRRTGSWIRLWEEERYSTLVHTLSSGQFSPSTSTLTMPLPNPTSLAPCSKPHSRTSTAALPSRSPSILPLHPTPVLPPVYQPKPSFHAASL
ncbi:hypothetical protein BKA70DRAFT_745625 [Coprinopsis sp. MPI-PUGE-AT-0042]|nr:hypothetical protein BKA70DRAFT_745625 [Coprinopsis sp. MPI-PUGE-AT-0042]